MKRGGEGSPNDGASPKAIFSPIVKEKKPMIEQ